VGLVGLLCPDANRCEPRGGRRLCDVISGEIYPPEDLWIDQRAQFEGETDLAEQVAVYALSSAPGVKRGTYVVAFSPLIDWNDVDVVRGLRDTRFSVAAN
jgi:hypothetical protein